MRWINTIEVAAEVEQTGTKGRWRIGDAIIKDLKDNNLLQKSDAYMGSPYEGQIEVSTFTDCAEKLQARGIEHNGNPYSHQYLRDLFQTAYAYSRDDRNAKYSWDAHREAGSPANLKKAAAALNKLDKTVTIYNVRNLISHWASEADAERRKELERAKAKKKVAKAKKAKASEDKLATKDKSEREAAEKRRQEAQREIEEATREIKETGSPPPFNADLDVDTTDVNALERWAVYMGITAHTMVMKREAKKTLKELAKIANLLTNDEQQTIADSCNEIIGLLEEINTLVKRPAKRLAAIQGGKS
jgi:hypothetical protein